MTLGISHVQLDSMSGAGLVREGLSNPIAQNLTYFSSATDGGAQAAQSISGQSNGFALFRGATAKRPLFIGRMPKVTLVNGSGLTISVTVRMACRRFGFLFTQDIVVATGALTGTGTNIVDEVVSMTLVNVTGAPGAGDTVSVGVDDSWLGLRAPIKSRKSIRMIYKIANGTPDAAGPKMNSDLTAAQVKTNRDSAINVNSLYTAAVLVTDVYHVEYSADGNPDHYPVTGLRFVG